MQTFKQTEYDARKTKIEERIVDVLKTVYDPEIPGISGVWG